MCGLDMPSYKLCEWKFGEHIGDKIFGVGHFGFNFNFDRNIGSHFQSSMPAINRSRRACKRFMGGVETTLDRSMGLCLLPLPISSNSTKLVLLKLCKRSLLYFCDFSGAIFTPQRNRKIWKFPFLSGLKLTDVKENINHSKTFF